MITCSWILCINCLNICSGYTDRVSINFDRTCIYIIGFIYAVVEGHILIDGE